MRDHTGFPFLKRTTPSVSGFAADSSLGEGAKTVEKASQSLRPQAQIKF